MIRFESAVSHDNRTHSTGRLRADVDEKVLHRGPPEASLLSRFWICGNRNTCTNVYHPFTDTELCRTSPWIRMKD
ncbi:hypothetical protein ALC56_14777 [Trachymyrmex septentrionalis]|uniref:Uncharacterized protein n=1 Tax=Trachymyrmex septentrionalis TaxID=34720 RepID=A0A195ERT3_9HYME|nr:hypothetical protein ALC56_14777 [Trachymyrmex septentrionalis]